MTEKITPETYEQMNKEFEEQGLLYNRCSNTRRNLIDTFILGEEK